MTDTSIGRGRRVAALVLFAFIFSCSVNLPLDGGGIMATAAAQEGGTVPGETLGATSDSDFWRAVREGASGSVSIPDKKAAIMIQSEGENWRNVRNGPLSTIGIWLLAGIIIVLALYFALRGRIRVEGGPSGRTVERFNGVERFAHWLTAGTFVVLAITGLNILYGRYLFAGQVADPSEFGALHQAFAALTYYGKFAHNFLAFGFMLGLVMLFVLWVRDNIPKKVDLQWLAKGGGMFSKGVHPPAEKFNGGQKILFWLVILGGLSLSLSGIALLFPFTFEMFGGTFAVLNVFGLGLPTDITPIEEMQLSQIWHAIVGLGMIAIIIAHIYIGSIGMEGAFDAMGTGMVDENWAREHHPLWAAKLKGEAPPRAGGGKGESGKESPQTA
ncbi:MAG TPA: formate dehydrogenase subunit gamma [Chromatiales bacterium]|nr:formate dehydrogenase subunit gamma [Chromatiales bacterium]